MTNCSYSGFISLSHKLIWTITVINSSLWKIFIVQLTQIVFIDKSVHEIHGHFNAHNTMQHVILIHDHALVISTQDLHQSLHSQAMICIYVGHSFQLVKKAIKPTHPLLHSCLFLTKKWQPSVSSF